MQPTCERSEEEAELRSKAIATIARLLAMGYSEANIQQALQHRGCDFDAALGWLLDHEMSDDFGEEDDDVRLATTYRASNAAEIQVVVPAVTHNNERRFHSNYDSADHYRRKEEPDEMKGTLPKKSNLESSSLPLPQPGLPSTKVELLDDSSGGKAAATIQQREIIVRRLCDLGYSSRAAKQSIREVGTEFDAALNWLLDRDESSAEDNDDWFKNHDSEKIYNKHSLASFPESNTIASQLCALGYSTNVVGQALNEVGSEFDAALNWLLDHCGNTEDDSKQWQVDDLLSFNSKRQQTMLMVTQQQQQRRFNDSPRSIGRGERRHHASKEDNEYVPVEKMEVQHSRLPHLTPHLNLNHHSDIGRTSGLSSSNNNNNKYVDWCMQQHSKNALVIELDQEALLSCGKDSTKSGIQRSSSSLIENSSLTSVEVDSFQPLGSCSSELPNDQSTTTATFSRGPFMQHSTVERRGGMGVERGCLGSRSGSVSPSAEWYDDMFHSHKGLEETMDDADDIIVPTLRRAGAAAAAAAADHPLPIDSHKEKILQHIEEHRVTIIEGETGCGKSSRIPQMLMEVNPNVRMYVSQPRRIAAYALMKHVRSVLAKEGQNEMKVGLRCGHGLRDDSTDTQILFCTAGYLLRLLAHHQEQFKDHTHLIIDEVHERSVDTDILCFLAKLLLSSHPTIKLVLMSATVAADMYRDYFSVVTESIHVGSQRYGTDILYCDEIARMVLAEEMLLNHHHSELNPCITMNMISTSTLPPKDVVQSQKVLALMLISWLGEMVSRNNPQDEGTSVAAGAVLVFVSGMADILELTEKLEHLKNPSQFKIIPIHSAFGFDEQMDAFEQVEKGVLKIVIATNAAESSLTLPDIDHVICLGTAKALQYNEALNRESLTARWISKSSAKQRAGRTGRVRHGTVYRMYTREVYESFDEFDTAEIRRRPLDSLILGLKAMLEQPVIPLLNSVLQPPSMTHVEKAFESLFKQRFIAEPSDTGDLTMHGKFVARLGLDLQVGNFVALGIQFGCLAEAVIIAAAISFGRSPFRVVSPLIHTDPDDFNHLMASVVKFSVELDAGWYCEPMIVAQILWGCSSLDPRERDYYCRRHFLSVTKVQQLNHHAKHIANRVASILGLTCPLLGTPPCTASLSKRNTIRMMLLWSFHTNLIVSQTSYTIPPSSGPVIINIEGPPHVRADEVLTKVAPPDAEIVVEDSRCTNFVYTAIGNSGSIYIGETWGNEVNDGTHKSFLQLGCNVKNLDACWIVGDERFSLHLTSKAVRKVGKHNLMNIFRDADIQEVIFKQEEEEKELEGNGGVTKPQSNAASSLPMFHLSGTQTPVRRRELQSLRELLPTSLSALAVQGTLTVYCCGFDPGEESLKHVFCKGDDPDHLYWTFNVRTWQKGLKKTKMVCAWSDPPFPLPPLFIDLPIAARQIGQMAAGQRGRMLKCWAPSTSKAAAADAISEVTTTVAKGRQGGYDEGLESEMATMEEGSRRHDEEVAACGEMEEADEKVEFWMDLPTPSWRCVQDFRGHNAKALVPEGTLGAAAVPNLQPSQNIYAVAANMLDLGAGNVTRAECLTLFPPGENWVHLGLVAYGLGGCAAAMGKCGGEEEEQFFAVDDDVKLKPFTSADRNAIMTDGPEGPGSSLLSGLSLKEDEYSNLQAAGQGPSMCKSQFFDLELQAAMAFSAALQMAPSIETQPLLIHALDEIFGFSHCREEYDDVVLENDEFKSPSFCLEELDDFQHAVGEALALAKSARKVRHAEANNLYWAPYYQG